MRQPVAERIKQTLRPILYPIVHQRKAAFACPICEYRGPFKDKRLSRVPDVVRVDSKCVRCGATERHRMLRLVVRDVLESWGTMEKSILHFAPEECLKPWLSAPFGSYQTADLFMPGVDFKEDIQSLSFADASFDCLVVSRVLTIPPDLDACLAEIRRVLKPGGLAVIAEIYSHEKTIEFGEMRNERSREIGVDALDRYSRHFKQVDRLLSDRYDEEHQLTNRVLRDGIPVDAYPDLVRVPGIGFRELVAVCYA